MAGDRLRERVDQLVHDAMSAELRGSAPPSSPPIAFSTWAELWLAERRQLQLVSEPDDATRLRLHVLPFCGGIVPANLADWRPKHVRALILHHRAEHKLSPRTIRHIYAVLSNLFRCAVASEMLPATPCVLPRGVVPPSVDKDPEWRERAVFTRSELEALLFDRRIPEDRRVLYGLKGIGALRHSEVKPLRFEQIVERQPLWAILLSRTKTKRQRAMPVHATLQWLLDSWRCSGWRRMFGRSPRPGDLVIPALRAKTRLDTTAQHDFGRDLVRLGLRHRRGHDLRRTMISLARSDGADRDKLKACTHGPSGSIIDLYTTWEWSVLCSEVAKLAIGAGRGGADQLELALPDPSSAGNRGRQAG